MQMENHRLAPAVSIMLTFADNAALALWLRTTPEGQGILDSIMPYWICRRQARAAKHALSDRLTQLEYQEAKAAGHGLLDELARQWGFTTNDTPMTAEELRRLLREKQLAADREVHRRESAKLYEWLSIEAEQDRKESQQP